MRSRLIIVAAGLVLAGLLAGCGAMAAHDANDERRGRGDAPVSRVDDTPKDVIQFPDRFSNVATACDGHGFRIFVTTKTDASRSMWAVADRNCTRPDHGGHIIDNGDSPPQVGSTDN